MDHLLFLLASLAAALVLASLALRRVEHRASKRSLQNRSQAVARGTHQARLQHPSIDLANCIGCGACVRACPEDGVLQMAHGQAVVVHGARCVGHGLCADACPTSAIALTLGDLSSRRDLPAVDERNQAVGTPGLFLAGEITGFALVRTAVAHGVAVANAVREHATGRDDQGEGVRDLVVIGAGPAGLACLLAAKKIGLSAVGLDREVAIGGTVAAYPRRKMVMTQAMDLPLHGRLSKLEYEKEQLVELWQDLVREHELPVHLGTTVDSVAQQRDGSFVVHAGENSYRARAVCLAVGRRGTPRRLGVVGEELPKVAYALLDAASYQGKRILVVGGGDSAVEAALALAEQPGNEVTLSYRKARFTRLKAKNEQRIQAALQDGLVLSMMPSVVDEIRADSVRLKLDQGRSGGLASTPEGRGRAAAIETATVTLANDLVFIFVGGTPPFPLLEGAGVSFDPELRPAESPAIDRGGGLLVPVLVTLVALLALWGVRLLFADYYALPIAWRSSSAMHEHLRPQGTVGLLAGMLAVLLFSLNLLYLVRRLRRFGRLLPGSLKAWMNVHVASGLGAMLLAVLHSGFSVRETAGGHALLTMLVVVGAGMVGRWFYAFVPRAQNGRQQDLEEIRLQVGAIASEWDDAGRGFPDDARRLVEDLVAKAGIGRSLASRVWGVVRGQWLLRSQLKAFSRQARQQDMPADRIARILRLARRSHALALQLAHYDDLRGLLSTWRWLHRWLALLLLALLVVHVVMAWRFGGIDLGVLVPGGGG